MYWQINWPFLAFSVLCLLLLTPKNRWAVIPITMIPMLALTLIFDNAIIAAGIVSYDTSKISGVLIGLAPIEDFAYTVAAALVIPSVWTFMGRKRK